MNPTNKETSGIQLPAPAEQAAPAPSGLPGEAAAPLGEQPIINTEKAPVPGLQPSAAPAATTIPLPLPNVPAAGVPAGQSAILMANPALLADDDKDLIEKEWVEKAKQIVERTRDDPYKQSEALTVFKADYIKKRYGKTIKVSH
jgi:hypothetical protein